MDRRRFLSAGIAVIGAISAPRIALGMSEPLRLAYFDNFAPFSWFDDKRGMQGIFIDALEEALHVRLGIALTHQGFPWARAQQLVKEGALDAFCTIPTTERRSYTEVSGEPVLIAHFTIFTRRNGPLLDRLRRVKTLDDLRPFLIAHYFGSGWAKQKLEGMQVDWAPNVDLALKKVANGRGDLHIDVAEMLRPRIKALGMTGELIELPQVLDTQPFNLCIRKTCSCVDILPNFDKTIRKMREDGSMQAIYRQYDALPEQGASSIHGAAMVP